jgi:hypothetical protein
VNDKETVAALVSAVAIPVGMAFSNPVHRAVLPSGVRDRLVIDAALGYLVAHGIITVKPLDEWPLTLPNRLPEDLAPDVQAEVDRALARGPLATS